MSGRPTIGVIGVDAETPSLVFGLGTSPLTGAVHISPDGGLFREDFERAAREGRKVELMASPEQVLAARPDGIVLGVEPDRVELWVDAMLRDKANGSPLRGILLAARPLDNLATARRIVSRAAAAGVRLDRLPVVAGQAAAFGGWLGTGVLGELDGLTLLVECEQRRFPMAVGRLWLELAWLTNRLLAPNRAVTATASRYEQSDVLTLTMQRGEPAMCHLAFALDDVATERRTLTVAGALGAIDVPLGIGVPRDRFLPRPTVRPGRGRAMHGVPHEGRTLSDGRWWVVRHWVGGLSADPDPARNIVLLRDEAVVQALRTSRDHGGSETPIDRVG